MERKEKTERKWENEEEKQKCGKEGRGTTAVHCTWRFVYYVIFYVAKQEQLSIIGDQSRAVSIGCTTENLVVLNLGHLLGLICLGWMTASSCEDRKEREEKRKEVTVIMTLPTHLLLLHSHPSCWRRQSKQHLCHPLSQRRSRCGHKPHTWQWPSRQVSQQPSILPLGHLYLTRQTHCHYLYRKASEKGGWGGGREKIKREMKTKAQRRDIFKYM